MSETTTNTPDKAPSLEKLLDEYALEAPSWESLAAWVTLYPQFKRELTDFTARWLEFEDQLAQERTPEVRSAEERTLTVARAKRVAYFERHFPDLDVIATAEAVHEPQSGAEMEDVPAEPASLDDLIKEVELTKTSFRKRLGLGPASWAHFRSGMLSTLTEKSTEVYYRILDEAAAILQTTRDRVLRSLPSAPVLPAGYSRAQARPEAGGQVDAVSSLESDASADPTAVAYYLRQEGTPPSQWEPANPTQP